MNNFDDGERVKMLDVAGIGVLTLLIAVVIFEIHIHDQLVLVDVRGGEDVADTPVDIADPPVIVVGIKTVQPPEKGRVHLVFFRCEDFVLEEKLVNVNMKHFCDLIECFDVYDDIAFFIFGDGRLAFVDGGGQLFQCHAPVCPEITDPLAGFHADL